MKLGPGLLEETDPELVVSACRKRWLSFGVAGEEFINEYGRFLTIQEESHHVDASLVHLLGDEHGLDALGELSQRAQGGEEVAVAKCTLVDIIRLNTILKDVDRVEYLTSSLPCELIESVTISI